MEISHESTEISYKSEKQSNETEENTKGSKILNPPEEYLFNKVLIFFPEFYEKCSQIIKDDKLTHQEKMNKIRNVTL